jgi:hypothetical protein
MKAIQAGTTIVPYDKVVSIQLLSSDKDSAAIFYDTLGMLHRCSNIEYQAFINRLKN